MIPPLDSVGRAELRALACWRGRRRPRALTGLVPLGRVVVAPFVMAAAVYATGTGRVTLLVERVQVGQLTLDRRGVLHPRGDLWRWLGRHAPTGAHLALRRELEHRLVAELWRSVWGAARAEVETRRAIAERASQLAHDTRPGEAGEAAS